MSDECYPGRPLNSIDQHVGANLRYQRSTSGFSVDQASAHLEVAATTLLAREAGEARPPPGAIVTLAKFHLCNIAVFFNGLDSALLSETSSSSDGIEEKISRMFGLDRQQNAAAN